MLTVRQQEFLDAALKLASTKDGVHYTEVADLLGVSKWTAYDILSDLAQRGYLRIGHVKSDCSKGRGRVIFYPPAEKPGDAASTANWQRRLEEVQTKGNHNVLEEVLKDLAHVRTPLAYCMGTVLAVLLALRQVAGSSMLPLDYLLPLLYASEAALVLFEGMSVSFILNHKGREVLPESFLQDMGIYEQKVGALNGRDKKELQKFCQSVLTALWPETARPQA